MLEEFEEALEEFSTQEQAELRGYWGRARSEAVRENLFGFVSIHLLERGTEDELPFGDLLIELEEAVR